MLRKVLSVTFAVCLSQPVPAETRKISSFVADYRELTGTIIATPNSGADGTYIDLGTKDGVRAGDVFTIVSTKESVEHPITKEEIAIEPGIETVLGITRTNPNYSDARLLKGKQPAPGSQIKRFSGLSAYFVDTESKGRDLYAKLRNQAPQIKWLGYLNTPFYEAPKGFDGLIFRYTGPALQVDLAPNWPVGSYSVEKDHPARQGLRARPQNGQGPQAAPKHVLSLEAQPISSDILVHESGILIVSGTSNRVTITSVVNDQARELTEFPVPSKNRLLAVRWWTPENHHQTFLALTTWDGQDVEGMLLKLNKDQVTVLRTDLPFILGTFDLDANKTPETLIGQAFEREGFFGQSMTELTLNNNDSLRQQKPSLDLPDTFHVIGSLIADLMGDEKMEFASIRDRKLIVTDSDGIIVHRTARHVGTDTSSLIYELDPAREFSPVMHIYFNPSPILATHFGAQHPAILFPRTQGSSAGFLSSEEDHSSKTQVGYLQFRDNQTIESDLPYRLKGTIASLAEKEGVILTLLSYDTLSSKSGASLLSMPLGY
ncbi:hypothetical protein [Marinobacter sp.]|uniref:hypothetical protein n=1 Tax=Marinobacter sp. TaxID=50741 RepID=UPI002E878FDD|nr:hypothetical protein [Pseudomonadota bacterium]MEE3116999.1 hypothetical protein [Pseudomonadota bacterium]